MRMRKCQKCGTYTMKPACPKDGTATMSPLPPSFSPEDRYGKYRRLAKTKDDAGRNSC
jgi:H/ACA ribonucleoprotein complex subunit 3